MGGILYMLDTNTVSYLMSGRSAAVRARYLAVENDSTIALSALTEAEVLFGFAKQPGAHRLRLVFEELLPTMLRLTWDSQAAASYAFFKMAMGKAGLSLALVDQLIASHAHAAGATLVTRDRAFHRLSPYLAVEDWATDL